MSQENIEIVRDQYAATNERDFARAMSHYADDVEMIVHHGLRGGVFNGRRAVGEWFGDWFATFETDARFDIEETTALNEACVLLVANHHASGRKSGVEVSEQVVWLYRIRDGKITGVEGFESRAKALEALGLEP